jgi:hypothetical protein
MRWVIGALGVGLSAWGAVLLLQLNLFEIGPWLLGGPLLHDALVAPLVGVAGLAITRVLPAGWRTPVAAGLVLTATLTMLAVPYLWRTFTGPTNPGLHDRPYLTGYLIALAVVWLTVLTTGFLPRKTPPGP